MATERKLIHEILADRLRLASTVGLRNYGAIFMIGEITCILEALEGKLKAEDAHKLAIQLADIPNLMRREHESDLAQMVEKTLEDLRNRKDEKKGEGPSPLDLMMAADPAGPRTV